MAQNKQVRDDIIREAAAIFARFGFRKATIDDIAAAIHKGKSSIYYYFDGKEAIFEAVVEHEIFQLRKRLRLAIHSSEDPREKLKNYVLTRMHSIRELANLYNVLKSDSLEKLDFVDRMRLKYHNEEVEMFKEILESGIKRNYFQINDINLASTGMVTALKGIEPRLVSYDKPELFEESLRNIINILLYGIVKR